MRLSRSDRRVGERRRTLPTNGRCTRQAGLHHASTDRLDTLAKDLPVGGYRTSGMRLSRSDRRVGERRRTLPTNGRCTRQTGLHHASIDRLDTLAKDLPVRGYRAGGTRLSRSDRPIGERWRTLPTNGCCTRQLGLHHASIDRLDIPAGGFPARGYRAGGMRLCRSDRRVGERWRTLPTNERCTRQAGLHHASIDRLDTLAKDLPVGSYRASGMRLRRSDRPIGERWRTLPTNGRCTRQLGLHHASIDRLDRLARERRPARYRAGAIRRGRNDGSTRIVGRR